MTPQHQKMLREWTLEGIRESRKQEAEKAKNKKAKK